VITTTILFSVGDLRVELDDYTKEGFIRDAAGSNEICLGYLDDDGARDEVEDLIDALRRALTMSATHRQAAEAFGVDRGEAA